MPDDLFISAQRFIKDLVNAWNPEDPFGKLLREAGSDSTLLSRLLESPAGAMADAGVELPDGATVDFKQLSNSDITTVLPEPGKRVSMSSEFIVNPLKKLIAQAQGDSSLREQLLTSPGEALKQAGLEIAGDANVAFIENTAGNYTIVLPAPESAERNEKMNSLKLGIVANTSQEITIDWVRPDYMTVNGTVDSETASILRVELDKADFDVDLNLGGIKFFSSQGIGMLVRTEKRLGAIGCRLRLLNVPEVLMNVLKIFRLLAVLEIENRSDDDLIQAYQF